MRWLGYAKRSFIIGSRLWPPASSLASPPKVSEFGYTAETFTEELCRRGGIMIRGDFHPEYVRISIGTMPQNEAVVKNVATMVKDKKRR